MGEKKRPKTAIKTLSKNVKQILPEETLYKELSLLIEKSKQKVPLICYFDKLAKE